MEITNHPFTLHQNNTLMKNLFLALALLIALTSGCKKEIDGCTDKSAYNYNAKATHNDGTCKYHTYGCTDPSSINYNPDADIDDGSCQYNGSVVFYYTTDWYPAATVHLNGEEGYITVYYDFQIPNCGDYGCATFSLPPGTYNYTATCSTYAWSGTVVVTSNGCTTKALF